MAVPVAVAITRSYASSSDQRFEEHGSLPVEAGIRIPAEDAYARAVDCGVEQSDGELWSQVKRGAGVSAAFIPRLPPRIAVVDDVGMSIEVWWPKLRQQSRDYLMENNGDEVPADLVEEIAGAGGLIATDAWWVGESGPAGLYLSDEAVGWIDEVSNGETPEPRAEDRAPTS